MSVPQVLPVADFRAHLAAHLNSVMQPGAEPLIVGSHRKPEVVVMSVQRYEQLLSEDERARREIIIAEAVASNRLEGATNSPEMLAAMNAWAAGEIDMDEVRRRLPAPR